MTDTTHIARGNDERRGPDERGVVFIVDDDAAMRESLEGLVRSVGLDAYAFGSAREFLAAKRPDAPGCLLLDVRLPGQSGLEFQLELARLNVRLPIVFITGFGDIPMTVRAMKAGAVEFLSKPFRSQDLLDAVTLALERDRKRRRDEGALSDMRGRRDSLTDREREVMALVTAGRMNKQVAAELGISEITAKVHRGRVMRKMGARSLADLITMAGALRVDGGNAPRLEAAAAKSPPKSGAS